MNTPRLPTSGTRNTNKFKFLTGLFTHQAEEIQEETETEGERGEMEEETEEGMRENQEKSDQEKTLEEVRKRISVTEGTSIILPGNIKSLVNRFRLVCAEREAGNVEATAPEIVAILDEFLRRRHISKIEYNAMCKGLGC